MIPLVFSAGSVLPDAHWSPAVPFPTPIGHLVDCISATVTEEINGAYELNIRYPMNGTDVGSIAINNIVAVIPNQYRKKQPQFTDQVDYFRIYRTSVGIDGLITANCEHITYWMRYQFTKSFTASKISEVYARFGDMIMGTTPFHYLYDTDKVGAFTNDGGRSIREVLFGTSNSILTVYGGEVETFHYDYNWFETSRSHADPNYPWVISYGTNMTDFKQDIEFGTAYTHVYCFWRSGNTYVDAPPVLTGYGTYYPNYGTIFPLDCSSIFQSQPSVAQLTNHANAYVAAASWDPSVTITVSAITAGIPDALSIGDKAVIVIPKYGINQESEVTSYEWDVLGERYERLTVGKVLTTLGEVLYGKRDK